MTTNGTHSGKGLRNQFGDYEDTSKMTVKDWTYRWEKDQTQFHMSKIHPMLAKHIDALTEGKKRLRFFVPLCGKTVDMRWLAEQGHEVIGLEAVEKGCREFFVEQKIPYSVKDLQNCKGKIFKATDDKKIQLYCCDFFDLERLSLGTFDCIWDRGSFVAVAVKERKRYSNKMTPLMKKDTKYLLDCFKVDNGIFGGPPFNCERKDVEENFGKSCTITEIDNKDAMTDWQREWGLTEFREEVYLLQKSEK